MTRLDWGHFNMAKVWIICKKSFPYAVLIFSMAVYLRSDSIIIERMLPDGKKEAGVFAASFRLLDVANNVSGVLFAGILLPLFGRLLIRKESVQPIVRQSVNLLLPVAFTTVVAAFFWGNEIMKALYVQATDYDGAVLAALMCAFPGFCIGYVYATLLTANGNIRALIRVSLIAVVVNLALNFIFIPQYGALGAAWSCALTQILLSVLNIRLARRIILLKPDWKWIGQYLAYFILMAGITVCIDRIPCSLLSKIGAMAVNSVCCMMICGFVPFRQIKHLFLPKV